jgi:hypothetical protein
MVKVSQARYKPRRLGKSLLHPPTLTMGGGLLHPQLWNRLFYLLNFRKSVKLPPSGFRWWFATVAVVLGSGFATLTIVLDGGFARVKWVCHSNDRFGQCFYYRNGALRPWHLWFSNVCTMIFIWTDCYLILVIYKVHSFQRLHHDFHMNWLLPNIGNIIVFRNKCEDESNIKRVTLLSFTSSWTCIHEAKHKKLETKPIKKPNILFAGSLRAPPSEGCNFLIWSTMEVYEYSLESLFQGISNGSGHIFKQVQKDLQIIVIKW